MNINSINTNYGYAEKNRNNKSNDYSQDKLNNLAINSEDRYTGEKARRRKILKEKYSKIIFQDNMDYYQEDDDLDYESTAYDDVKQISKKLSDRRDVNTYLKSLFEKNNVNIPENIKLTFKIEPYTYNLTVSGTEDLNLINTIEQLLNREDNAKELFFHIIKSCTNDSRQCTKEKLEKYRLNLELKKYIGCDLRDLRVVDGKFITEDGINISEVYSDALKYNYPVVASYKANVLAYYTGKLNDLAKNGYNSIEDLVLSIDYKNGSLYDVGQKYNFGVGKTKWIEKLKEKIG